MNICQRELSDRQIRARKFRTSDGEHVRYGNLSDGPFNAIGPLGLHLSCRSWLRWASLHNRGNIVSWSIGVIGLAVGNSVNMGRCWRVSISWINSLKERLLALMQQLC